MKFDYGDQIIVKKEAPLNYRPGEFGAICGITIIDNDELSIFYELNIGTITYTVEYIDGTDRQIPEEFLEFDTVNY